MGVCAGKGAGDWGRWGYWDGLFCVENVIFKYVPKNWASNEKVKRFIVINWPLKKPLKKPYKKQSYALKKIVMLVTNELFCISSTCNTDGCLWVSSILMTPTMLHMPVHLAWLQIMFILIVIVIFFLMLVTVYFIINHCIKWDGPSFTISKKWIYCMH